MTKKQKKLLSEMATVLINKYPGCFDNPALAVNVVKGCNAIKTGKYLRDGKPVQTADDFGMPKLFNPHKRLTNHLCEQWSLLDQKTKNLPSSELVNLLIDKLVVVYNLKRESKEIVKDESISANQ